MRHERTLRNAFRVVLLFCTSAAGAQQAAAAAATSSQPLQSAEPIVTLKANARAVLLDIVVTDAKGRAIHGLKREDFQILEDARPQTVASFEEHQPVATEALQAPPPLPPNTWTNLKPPPDDSASIVLLLDAIDTPPPAQAFVRSQLLSYVNSLSAQSISPRTQIAIFQLDTSLHLIQGFTSDPEVLRRAVKEREKTLLSPLPQVPAYVGQALQMDALTRGMQALGAYLQTRPGHKSLIWFTARVPRTTYDSGSAVGGSLRDRESFVFDYTQATDALVLGEVSIYPVDSRGLQTDPSFSAASRTGPTPRSTRQFENAQFYQHADLDEVAEATGGKAFYNTNGLKEVVSEVAENGASYYSVSFYPTNKNWDGAYRQLKVELDRQGMRLQYRHGYYAQRDTGRARLPRQSAANAGQPARIQLTHTQPGGFAQAMQLGAVDPAQIVFRAHVAFDPAIQKLAKDQPPPKDNTLGPKFLDRPFRDYLVSYEVPGNQLNLTTLPNGLHHGQIEFAALVLDDKGGIISSSKSIVEINFKPETYKRILSTGVGMPVKIAVPEKGTYFLRVGVHDIADDRAGALEVSIGDIQATPPATP